MTGIFDMHVHTTNSPDAGLSETEIAKRAVAAGLKGVGLVAHVDFHPRDFCSLFFDPARYDSAVECARGSSPGVRLLKGVEIGEPHLYEHLAKERMDGREYDFLIGGLHWVDDRMVLEAEGFDGVEPLSLVEEYFRQLQEMVSRCDIDILAHVGIFRRGLARAKLDCGFDETALWPALTDGLLAAMIERGIALEINTSGLRRTERVTYPQAPLLRRYRELGGRLITLGSDTHADPWVFYGLDEGVALLQSVGFESAFFFEARQPQAYFPGAGSGQSM